MMKFRDSHHNAEDEPDDDTAGEPEAIGDEDLSWSARAHDIIPGGASTGSKQPASLYGADVHAPTHFVSASGCTITLPSGDELIDCSMALGSVALGYADDVVTQFVAQAARAGNVAGLSPVFEVDLAERLVEVIPCAEQVRFLKTGAEAVAAAVRIARTSTARDVVVGSGYFGWLDWCSSEPGVPQSARQDFISVPFDDVAALERAVDAAGPRLAAIVLEPVVERLPNPEWIATARRLANKTGAVLIFDEIKTAFRLATGGYQEYAQVEPDLAAIGKAMANGYPLSAVVGRAAIMEAARHTWISSTLASETTALAAAMAVLDWHERVEVCETLWEVGEKMMTGVRAAIAASGIPGVTVEGIAPMWFLRWEDPAMETRFLELAVGRGVLFKRGPYNFASVAHDDDALTAIESAASTAFVDLREERE